MRKYIVFLLAVSSIFILDGCKVVKSPPQYYIKRKAIQYDPYGSWVNVEYRDANNILAVFGGELLSIERDTIFLLDLSSNLHTFPIAKVTNAYALLHRPVANDKQLSWAAGGLLFSITNGPFIIFTGPAWIVAGTTALIKGDVMTENYRNLDEHEWEDLAKFGRFPKGIPPSVNPNELEAKPFGEKYKLKK